MLKHSMAQRIELWPLEKLIHSDTQVAQIAASIAELDGTFRKITVTVNAPGRPNVRSRNGYYANASVKK